MTVSEETLKTIKEKGLRPRPRWQFLLKEEALWALGVACLLLGGLAVAVMLYTTQDGDWEIYQKSIPNHIRLIIEAIPFFWIIGVILFAILARGVLRHTRRGYGMAAPLVIGLVILSSIVLGEVINVAGGGQAMHNYLIQTSILYRRSIFRERFWMRPEAGFLAGTVKKITADGFTLSDRFGNQWAISVDRALMNQGGIRVGDQVRITGVWQGGHVFIAQEVQPWDHANTPYPITPRNNRTFNSRPGYNK